MKQRQIRTYEAEYIELINKIDDNTETAGPIYNPPITETTINEGDTLQSLSIQYQCPVSELKRLNNLHRDNEIFARRTIKIPFRPFSMVAIHKSGDSSPNTLPLKKSVNANILKEKLASFSTNNYEDNVVHINGVTPTSSRTNDHKTNLNEIIFNTTITENELPDDLDELSDEEVQLLPNSTVILQTQKDFDCSGSDWGLSWPILLALILLTAFIVPLIYIFYIAEHPEKYHHHVS